MNTRLERSVGIAAALGLATGAFLPDPPFKSRLPDCARKTPTLKFDSK